METMQTVIGESHALNTALDHISNLAEIDRSILVTGERVQVKKSRPIGSTSYLPGGRDPSSN